MLFFVSELKAGAYSGTCGDGAQWSIDSGVLTISGVGTTGTYRAVSGSRSPWYCHRDEILFIKISEGITSIGVGSFQDCDNVVEVSLPESLKEISEMSFSGCNKLQQLSIPASVEKIDASAFLECSVLENISVDADNTLFSDEDGVLFSENKDKIILFPKGKISAEYSIPEGVTEIGAYAFANCSELIRIDIPSSVKDIGMSAFVNCRTLISANIPEGVTAIKSSTFFGCSGIYEVKLPTTVEAICSNAFGKCGSLMKINIPNATSTIDATAFSGCPNLTVHCEKDSYANMYCINNFIDYFYSNIASLFPIYYSSVYNGHTYGRFETACTWQEAKFVCEMLGGHLATVTSAEEMTVIQSLLSDGTPDSYWLGATDEETEGTWKWITGEDFNYSLWGYGQPDNCGDVEDYLETWGKGSSWNDNNNYGNYTGATRGFVCEYEDFYSPDQTITYNDHIYSLYNESLTWTEAKAFCESIGGHLVTISDQAEQDAINTLFYLPKKWLYWIGFYDSNLDGTWEWVTGEPVTYTNWNTGEPNGATETTHTYAHMYSIQSGSNLKGCWNDEYNDGNGTSHYRLANTGFICEIEPENYSPLTGGYYNGNRYEVYNYNISWTDSQTFAQSKGGHLVTITDSQEASFVQQLYSDLTLSDEYLNIGGFRYNHENKYRWVTGETFNYTNWNYGEPNNQQLVESHLQIYRYSNGWNDTGNRGSYYDGNVFIIEYESPKEILTLSEPDGTVINRYKVQGGLTVDRPIKDYKPGYTAEWYKEPSLQNKWNFETDVITEDTTLYAKFTPKTCVVDFEPNGGECSTDSKSVTFGTSYGNLPTPTKVGYTFAGWYADEAFTAAVKNVTAVSIAENHTLYAKWQAKTYTVSFDGNGGTLNVSTKTVAFGEPYGELPECSRAGSDFLGWYSDPDCSELVDKNSTVTIAQNHTLYAGWNESAVTSLKLITKPNKTEYYVGDSLDTTGLSIQATFANGSTGELPADKMTYSITEFISSGKKIVKASYGNKYASFIVNVYDRVLLSASVSTLPQKLSYTIGESLDTTGLVLTATYDNSSTKTVTEGFAAICDMTSEGIKTVNIEYAENGVTVSTSYEITVNPEIEEPDAVISAASVSVTAGETVSIPFYIENNQGFMGFAITVDYDSEAFTPVSVTSGEILGSGTLNDSIGSSYEYLKIVFVASEDVTRDGELFAVDFLVNENASDNYSFKVSYLQPDTFNESLNNVVFECGSFNIDVSNTDVEQSVKIGGGLINAEAGSTVAVPVSVVNGFGINSFSLKISYNNASISFVSAANGDALPDGTIQAAVNDSSNEIILSWSGSAITKDGALFYITFEAEEYVHANETITISCESIAFEDGSTKKIICNSANISISNPYLNEPAVIYSEEWLRVIDATIEVPVYIKNNHGIMGLGLYFEYDSSIITPLDVTAGEMLSSGYFVDNIGTNTNSFKILWNHTENITDNGLLLTLRFSVAEGIRPENVPLTITFSQPDTYNEKWEDVCLDIDIPEIGIEYNSIYTLSFYCKSSLVATRSYTIENTIEDIMLPDVPILKGYIVEWPEFELEYKDSSVYAICTPIEYTARFIADGELVEAQTFTVETEKLNEPPIPQKAGYIAQWSYYKIQANDIEITAKYYLPDVVLPSVFTVNVNETLRLLASSNFHVTEKVWTSSDTSVATVSQGGKVTAVAKGECKITVTCYGKDSLGNDIQASDSTRIIVNEAAGSKDIKQIFRKKFDEFFEVTLHDLSYNLQKFMIVLLKYVY